MTRDMRVPALVATGTGLALGGARRVRFWLTCALCSLLLVGGMSGTGQAATRYTKDKLKAADGAETTAPKPSGGTPINAPEKADALMILEDDRIVAFCVVAPDMNRSVIKFNGRFGWLEKLRLVYDCRVRPLTYCRAIIMGVARSHQWKRLHHAIILNIFTNFLENHPTMVSCDCSLIPESLEQWNKTLLDYGGDRYKTFRLYDRAI